MANQIVVSAGAKVRNLQDVIIGTSGVLTSLGFDVANGVPRLDVNGKILVSQLPNSVMEYKGVWNAATNTPTLANGTGNQGDVYLCNVAGTVDFGAGPIAFVVGDQVIYSGSIWQRASGATGTVTSVAITESGDSLNITGSPITTSGTINIGFNGTNLQYVNGAGNLTTFPTLITSIGLSMPSAFSVANSPLTANGTIAVTGAGVASQYIRGDGTLADFPSSGGGGSSVSYYLNGGTSQGTIGGTTYYEMSKTAVIGTGVDFAKSGDGLIVAFLTDANDPAQLNIPAGNWNYEIYAQMSSNGGTPQMYAELYKYDGTTFTLISTSPNEILYDGTALNLYTFAMAVPETSLTLTDRLAVKLYATNSGGKTTTIHTQNGHLCQIITTFSTGLTALNGLTAQVQNLTTGTSGTDFNINSLVDTHTFNLPTASAANRGALSSADWSVFNAKQNAITLTTTGTSGAATLVGATLNIPDYGSALSGYLPLTGGTLTGALNGTSATFSSTIDLTGNLTTTGSSSTAYGIISGIQFKNSFNSANVKAKIVSINGADSDDMGLSFQTSTTTSNVSEKLRIVGSGAATFTSSVTATSFIKTSGTSSQFLKADGSVDSSTYLTTSAASSTYLPLTGGTLTGALGGTSATFSSNVFTLRSNIGTGTSDDADISLNVSAPSGVNKSIMFGRNSSNVLVFAISSAGYISTTGGNFIAASGTAIDVAGNAIFRGDTGVGTPRQLIITSGGSTPVYLEAKGYGANYQTDFGIRTFNNVGTSFEVFYADSSGRVGINQVSPSYQLDVNGTGRFVGILNVFAPSANYATLNLNGATGYGAELKFGEATGGYLAAIRHNYNVGTGLEFYTGGLAAGNLRMYISPTGNVGIGTSTPSVRLDLGNNVGTANTANQIALYGGGQYGFGVSAGHLNYISGGAHSFYNTATTATQMIITSGGNVLIGNGASDVGSLIHAYTADNRDNMVYTNANASLTYAIFAAKTARAASTSCYFYYGEANSVTTYRVYNNGNVQNTNNSYTGISDISIKENILDATPKLADLLKVRIVNYNLKAPYENHKQIGVIAQELEKIFPNMIDIDTNTKLKSVKYSIFVPMLIKAVQELKQEIETLKNK
jgi:hypothetical protein